MNYPNVLTIAGSDSGGGAGIQADLKTITCLGGFGMSVITALTAQNGLGVTGIHACPANFVVKQLETLEAGFNFSAAKTGMLFNKEIMLALGSALSERNYPLVVDPVCVSQSGHALMEEEAISTLREKILPLADILTPNIPEAEVLSGQSINSEEGVDRAARILLSMGAKHVLVKGGHYFSENTDRLTDWLFMSDGTKLDLPHERVRTGNNHGTGCTLSAAIAFFLGRGLNIAEAIRSAQNYLLKGLERSFTPGKGAGPINFLAAAGYIVGS